MLRFPNEENNEWLNKYNSLIDDIENGRIQFSKEYLKVNKNDYTNREEYRIARLKLGSGGYHHIIPKKVNPELENVKDNKVWVPFIEHMNLHYYLWKYNKYYGIHLWFGCVFGRKHKLWDLPTEDEYNQLKKDVNEYIKNKKKGINN